MDTSPDRSLRGLDRVKDPVAREFLREKLPAIRQAFSPRHIIVFGSRSRGEGTEDSDIDLVIVADSFQTVRWVNRAGLFLNTVWPQPSVDPLCYTPEEFEDKRKWPGVVKTACEEGVWL